MTYNFSQLSLPTALKLFSNRRTSNLILRLDFFSRLLLRYECFCHWSKYDWCFTMVILPGQSRYKIRSMVMIWRGWADNISIAKQRQKTPTSSTNASTVLLLIQSWLMLNAYEGTRRRFDYFAATQRCFFSKIRKGFINRSPAQSQSRQRRRHWFDSIYHRKTVLHLRMNPAHIIAKEDEAPHFGSVTRKRTKNLNENRVGRSMLVFSGCFKHCHWISSWCITAART